MVPEVWRHTIFNAIHDLVHPSGKATLAIIAKSYAWRNMRRIVLQWARQCQACTTSKIARHTSPPVLPIPVPAKRFGHVHEDIVGPLSSDQGFRYLLTMIDRITLWPEAVPIADKTVETILQAFLGTWISCFGIPSTVTSDRSAQFTLAAWQTSLTPLGINISATTAYHPQFEWRRGAVPQDAKELPSLRGLHKQIVDAIASLGVAGDPQRAEDQHSDLNGGGSFRSPSANPQPLLPERTIAKALCCRAAQAVKNKCGSLHSRVALPQPVQGLAFHR